MRSPSKKFDSDRAIAESPLPIFAVRPMGAFRKHERRINCDALRAEAARTPPPTPEKRPVSPLPTPPSKRKKDPYDSIFIRRPPPASPLKSATERVRHASSPYPSPSSTPSRRRILERIASNSGPSPGFYNGKVPQTFLLPPAGANKPPLNRDAPENIVLLGSSIVGCCVTRPDAVEKGPLSIKYKYIELAFQWEGYESLGPFTGSVTISNCPSPFDARLKILGKIKDMFNQFKSTVERERRENNMPTPKLDILAFGDCDFRVVKLERRFQNHYQVMFTVPTSKD